ncbi:4-cresol dehydrogenase [hydroxylating] flavoprotein subunit [compost metagenome]
MSKNATELLNILKSVSCGEIIDGIQQLTQESDNVGSFVRSFPAIVKVRSVSEVETLVKEAQRLEVALYPYSGGNNWGYGSKLPHQDGEILVDLSGLNKIIKIDEEHGIVLIEPGVTQKQLADELLRRNSAYTLDVTGSGADTTILGNALERGIAYQGIRVQQVMGLEVLLADGTRFKTGFGNYPHPVLEGLYPYGLGPSVESLFFQSNLGIILQGAIKLQLRPESTFAISLSVSTEKLSDLVEKLKLLRRNGCLQGIPHIANRERTISTMIPLVQAERPSLSALEARELLDRSLPGDWTVTMAVSGPKAVARVKLSAVKKKLKGMGFLFAHSFDRYSWQSKVQNILLSLLANKDQKLIFKAAETLRGLHLGQPTNAGVQFLMDKNQVDHSPEGFLLCTPLAPLTGEHALTYNEIVKTHAAKFDVRLAMTLNIITEQILEAVISVHFDRNNQAERDRAHACVKEMTTVFSNLGFYPYRLNIDQMSDVLNQSPHHQIIKRIKTALDPRGIIAPGRYEV